MHHQDSETHSGQLNADTIDLNELISIAVDNVTFKAKLLKRFEDDIENWDEMLRSVAQHDSTTTEFLVEFAPDLAWRMRQNEIIIRDKYQDDELCVITDRMTRFAFQYLALTMARFNYDCERIRSLLETFDKRLLDESGIFTAFELFAELFLRQDPAPERIQKFAQEQKFSKNLIIVLQGMCLAPTNNYGFEIEFVADKVLTFTQRDPHVWARRAIGYMRQGRFEEALQDTEKALHLLDRSALQVHDQYSYQRTQIIERIDVAESQRLLQEQFEESLKKGVDEAISLMDERSHDLLFRIMEILGLFVALIGVLATTVGVSIAGNLTFTERILILSTSSVFIIFFFVMIHVLTKPKHRR